MPKNSNNGAQPTPKVNIVDTTVGGNITEVHKEKLKPLKPHELEQLAQNELNALKSRYLTHQEIKRLFGKPLDIERSYVNLSVIEAQKVEKVEENEQKETEDKGASYKLSLRWSGKPNEKE